MLSSYQRKKDYNYSEKSLKIVVGAAKPQTYRNCQ